MKEGLRSGKFKVEKEKGSLKQTVVGNKGDEETPHLVLDGGDGPEFDHVGETGNGGGVVERKKVNGQVPIVGRVLRSRVVANGGGEGVGETGKKRRLVDNGDDKKGKEEKVGGQVGIAGRVLRSRTVVNGGGVKVESDGGEMEDVGVVEKRKRRRLVKKGENVVDDGLEKKKGKEEGDGKVLNAGRVLRSRTVVNGECDKAESGGDKAESCGDKAESDGGKAESNGDMAESGGDKAESGGVKAESDGGKAESNGDMAENGGDKTESDGNKSESDGVKTESDGDRAESDSDMGEKENVEVAEFGKKSRFVGNGGGVEKNKVKETEVGGKAPVAGRVLRSRTVVNGGFMAESDGALVRESRRKDVSHKKFSDVKNEGEDQLVTGFTKKLKGKRGRPPKVKKEENGRSGDGLRKLKGKRGRPVKKEREESDLLDGRLRKKLRSGQNSSENLKGNLDEEGNVYFKRKSGSKSQERVKPSTVTNDSYLERKRIRKELDVKASSQVKRDTKGRYVESEDSEDGDEHKEPKQKQSGDNKQRSKSKDGIRELKQAVSEKIVKMILAAGWTVERRQRNGREYMDAVYVCPAGKTHWSVTKAYNAFKVGCENGDPMTCKDGFKFTLIPPEELNMLQRVVNKKVRKNKKKKKKKGKGKGQGNSNGKQKAKDGDVSDEGIEEKRKKKLGKSLKGKHLLLEKDASTSTACEGELCLVQRHKRQKTQNRKRCALLVRNSENVDSENDGYIPYDGKRTVLAWMVDLGTLSLNSKLKYMNKRKRKVLLEGKIARDGIHCGCCDKTISLSEFVTHTRRDYSEPLRYILTDSGSSLLQCLLNSWNKQEESERWGFHFVEVTEEDPNDDTCGICGDGGDLICCDSCPSTFHKSCLEIKKFPSGDWHCVYCSCKFCGMFDENMCQRDSSENVVASALLTCHLCEEKYHPCCIQAKDAVNGDSSSPSFCAKNCQELFEKLERLLGVRHEVEEGFSLTLLRRFDVGDKPQKVDCNSKLIECNAKLAVAFLIMDECFLPMVDHRSEVNLIHNILYNCRSNFNRLNYGGFFTAILERGDEIISAATIRIHGNYLAEMPFIGTRYMYRRQGMCRRLLSAIESALCSLKVERLVIPAISELTETWTSVFGFKSLEESSKQKMKNMNILVFPGVDILQKPLLNQLTEKNKSPVKGLSFADLEHHKTIKDVVCNTEEGRLARSDSEATAPCVHEGNDELAAVQSDTQLLCDVSRDNLESKTNTIPIPTDSVCDVLEPTKEINECQNSASVADVRALELVTKQNQPELLCNTAEGFLAGSDAEATASFKHKANDELVAVQSDTQLPSGVSHDNVEGENNSMTIPTGPISDAHEQTEDTQLLCGVSHDNREVNNTLTIPTGSISNGHEQTEERNEHQNSDSVPDVKEVELGTKQNQYSMSKVERKSDLHPEGTDSAIEVRCALGEGTENIDRKVRMEADIVKPFASYEEFFCPCTENNATELQNVSLVHEANVSSENIVRTGSEITTQISHDARDHKHHDSQHLQVEGSIFRSDENLLETFEVENNHSFIQHTSIVTEGVHPESIKCSDSRILTKTGKVAGDGFHQAAALTHEEADDSKGHSTTLLLGSSIICTSGNGKNTHKVVSTPADNNSHPSCGANINSNGNSNAPDVPGVYFTSNGAHMNTKSLQQSDIDNNSIRQPNSSNTCASGGGNSFGPSEVTILSNQGQAS
ncbi:uncharacterized protein LOC133741545 isoform X1 [Rosa rugosa]|uniref:uncharacterized protein LOC133741545 isoform X1 n=1 Tax=Rosa rugosa TaxID=74645 RepID=UPI002B416C9F|nr:uncharacterized protein LOC133741545 isoform X1 [Rosa rugosa]